MPDNPLVSIVMCTYNGEKYLRFQLDTIIDQTYTNTEIIVVDDCSSDNTPKILQEYSRQYSNIHVFHNETNMGVNKNFEKGISLAGGELIALSDQDDIWDKNKIELLVNKMQDNVLVYCDSELVDSDGKSLNRRFSDAARFINGQDPLPFFFNNCCSGHAMLFKKELVRTALPIKLKKGTGVYCDQWLGLAANCVGKIDYIQTPLVKYRQHLQSVTDLSSLKGKVISRKEKKRLDVENMISRFEALSLLESIPDNDKVIVNQLLELYKRRLSNYFSMALFLFLMRNRHRFFKISLKSDWKIIRNCFTLSFGVK